MNDSTTTHPEAPPYLKAWDDYVSACQALCERLSNPAAPAAGGAVPLAFLGSWKDFAASLGMRPDAAPGDSSNPEDKFASLFPALGYSREYQEIGRRMLDLTGQFQRRYAEFLQHSADIGQSAFQATQRRASKMTRCWLRRPRSTMLGSTVPKRRMRKPRMANRSRDCWLISAIS